MTFSSLEFLFLFAPVFFAGYFVSKSPRWRNAWLFAASMLFYSWGEPIFVALMLVSLLLNYGIALVMTSREARRWRLSWLWAGVTLNVGLLAAFKYTAFAVEVVAGLLGSAAPVVELPLPLGISFYTFQALAYLIDLSRGHYPAERSLVKLALVIAAFPTVTAGPILRYKEMREQLGARDVDLAQVSQGLRRICIGLGKKILIANSVAFIASKVFAYGPDQYGAMGAWLGAICWALQIYFDFSGYSDIAIGLGTMMGFRYPENFNYPYIARSVSDFWRRWHMSLSSFFRDYVYIPLGGSRVSNARWVFNMGVVWALTGLWHGANWTFVFWGLYYGVMLAAERFVLRGFIERGPRILQHTYLLLVVLVGWVFFMSPSITDAAEILRAMLGLYGTGDISTLVLMRAIQPLHLLAVLAGVLGSAPWYRHRFFSWREREGVGYAIDVTLLVIAALAVCMVVVSTFSPFLYFRF